MGDCVCSGLLGFMTCLERDRDEIVVDEVEMEF